MFCKNCGNEVITQKAIACLKCGFDPKSENNFCPECGAETKDKQIICIKCGIELKPQKVQPEIINKKNSTTINKSNLNYPALITSILIIISVFMPWVEASCSASFMGQSANFTSGSTGINFADGIFGILIAIIGGIMAYNRIKWTFLAGLLNSLVGIAHIFGWFRSGYSSSYGSASVNASIQPQIGLILFVLFSLIFLIFTIRYVSNIYKQGISENEISESGTSISFSEKINKIVESIYFNYVSIAVLFLISVLFFYSKFPMWDLIFIAYPIYFALKRGHRFLFSMLISLVLAYLTNYLFNFLRPSAEESPVFEEIKSSFMSSTIYFYRFFILFFIISILFEIFKEKKNIIIDIVKKLKINKFGWIIAFIPFLISFSIYLKINLSKIHKVPDNEINKIKSFFLRFEKDWVLIPFHNNIVFQNDKNEIQLYFSPLEIESNNYGEIHCEQRIQYNGETYISNLNYDVRNYRMSCKIDYKTIEGKIISLDTLKSDTLYLSINNYNNSYIKMHFYAIPVEKYTPIKKDTVIVNSNIMNPKSVINEIYNDWKNHIGFDASKYFASNVAQFILMKNTNAESISKYISNTYYKDYSDIDYFIDNDSFNEKKLDDGTSEITYTETGSCYRISKQKSIKTKIQILLKFNSDNKIISWKQTKIIEREQN